MAGNKKGNNKKLVILVVALAVVLAALLIAAFILDGAKNPDSQAGTTGTAGSSATTEPKLTLPPKPTSDLEQRVEGSYEQWLASAGMYGISMQYLGGLPVGIYAPASTPFENRSQSGGVYIRVQTADAEILIHCKPLDAERTEKGTVDLYTKELGYNTFDEIPMSEVDLSAMEVLKFEDLGAYMDQTLLPTVLEH